MVGTANRQLKLLSERLYEEYTYQILILGLLVPATLVHDWKLNEDLTTEHALAS